MLRLAQVPRGRRRVERTHYQRQSTIVGMITQAVENARRSGAPARFDKASGEGAAGSFGRLQARRIRLGSLDHVRPALRLTQ